MKSLNILHIIDHLGHGGAQTVVKGIFENDTNNIFIYSLREAEDSYNLDSNKVFIYKSKKRFSFKPIKDIINIIKEYKIDILHCHLFRSQIFGFIIKKFYIPDIKLIFHEHGQIFGSDTNNKIEDFIYVNIMKMMKSRVDKFIGVSKTTKEALIRRCKIEEKKIYVLYNFVNLEKFNTNIDFNLKEEKKKYNIEDEQFVIGYVGRLSKIKGCEYLIKALPYLKFKYKLLIAGDGYYKQYLIDLSKKLNVYNNVIFLGYVNNISKLYKIFDIVVVPSIFESFGISAIESMACGVPVIASNIFGLKEIIEDGKNGLLFNSKDVKNLNDKINLIYNDKKLHNRLSKNGINYSSNFSIDYYIKLLKNIYEF